MQMIPFDPEKFSRNINRRTFLGQAAYGLERMCADTWRWQQGNPQGYSAA